MANVALILTGDKELAAKFGKLSSSLRGQSLVRALEAGAMPIVNDAKQRAPYKTGNLRRSIHVGDQQSSGSTASVKVGTDVEYARRIELGFAGADSLGRVYNQPARPYLRPALDAKKGDAREEVADALRDLIRAATA